MNDPNPRLSLLMLASLMLAGCSLQSAQDVTNEVLAVEPGTAVRVETRNGRIDVGPGADRAVALKTVRTARALSNPRARLDKIQVLKERKPTLLRIWSEHPGGALTEQYQVDLALNVPVATPLQATSRNGAVTVTGLKGPVRIETRNGALHGLDLLGEVDARTRNGTIRLTGVLPKVTAETENGRIEVTLKAGSTLSGPCRLETRNGAITLRIPRGLNARVSASTRNGKITGAVPLERSGQGKATATLGAGGPEITLSTRNGAIRIEQ
jgi:hypothetical protein